MGFKNAINKLKLKALEVLTPEADEDSWADLKKHELEGKIERAEAGVPEPPKEDPAASAAPPKPIFRRDGQVGNLNALPFPGQKPRPTLAQLNARTGGARPAPRHNVAWIANETELEGPATSERGEDEDGQYRGGPAPTAPRLVLGAAPVAVVESGDDCEGDCCVNDHEGDDE
jgi:hypothetical protein